MSETRQILENPEEVEKAVSSFKTTFESLQN